MPHVVVRLYTDSGDLISKIRERADEVREIMLAVPGFLTYGIVDTGSGAFSITTCEDKAGCDESVRRAAEWIKSNLPDANIAPPRIVEGESIFRILHRVSENQPHVVVRLFSDPPPNGFKEMEGDIRELLAGVAGLRSYSAMDTGSGGVTLIVCDDKASADECGRRLREHAQARYPEALSGTPPRIIEGEGVLRFAAQEVQVAPA